MPRKRGLMSALSMISLPIDLRAFRQWAATRAYSVDEGRALHHLLGEAFGRGTIKPFRLMVARGARRGTLYGYTTKDEAQLRATALETATPDVLAVANPAPLATKELPATWRTGRRLAFDVRIRPVRRLTKPLEGQTREQERHRQLGTEVPPAFRKGAEVDAFLVERLRSHRDGPPEGADLRDREAIYIDWLKERLQPAAELIAQHTRMAHYRRMMVDRREQSEGPDAVMHGELAIADSAAFSHLLAKGLGRHTSYGYGMLLLRPAEG